MTDSDIEAALEKRFKLNIQNCKKQWELYNEDRNKSAKNLFLRAIYDSIRNSERIAERLNNQRMLGVVDTLKEIYQFPDLYRQFIPRKKREVQTKLEDHFIDDTIDIEVD